MSKEKNVRFRQSLADFPLTVELGERSPTWGLSRWNGNNGLRFVPSDDEGFSLRGDKRQLVYKGRRRSHRFTIHSDTSFEYDCILNKEPESNVITLRMEGAEYYDFFQQPDFVPDLFLKGSYAVYKKETLIGEGTGKLCHIHRPEIIDARGRRCWGELSIVGNCLCITIPEQWLAEAAYPVIVDPTVGTSTIGSLTHWDNEDNESYDQFYIEYGSCVNRFLVPQTLAGTATAFIYAYEPDYEGPIRPVLFSDNNNSPLARRSANEGFIDGEVRAGKPAGWRSANFDTNTSIASGTNIWFGVFTMWFSTRFDFGAKSYFGDWSNSYPNIPSTFPLFHVNWFSNFKPSMYFTYSSAQNYVRTLTQGVTLTDSPRRTVEYKRNAIETARVNTALSRFETFLRKCEITVRNTMSINRLPNFFRNITENIKASSEKKENRFIPRMCVDDVSVSTENKRTLSIFRSLQNSLKALDSQSSPLHYVRFVNDEVIPEHKISHWGSFFRGLFITADNTAETIHGANYHRFHADTVQADGSVFRGLLLFVKIISQAFVRDYLLGRFLKSRQEIVLKSCVCRELKLESKIG